MMDPSKYSYPEGVNVSVISPSAYVRCSAFHFDTYFTYHHSTFSCLFQPAPNAQYPPYPNAMPSTDTVVTQPQAQPLADFRSKYKHTHTSNDFIHKNIASIAQHRTSNTPKSSDLLCCR